MTRIFLIGYMGVGKTTAGRELAKSLNLEFVDLDHFIQTRYNKTISQLFEQFGEEGFREIENKILKEVADFEDVVISTGGGAPCFYDNMETMNAAGTTVYMKASPELLSERLDLCKEKRPLIKDKNKEELLLFIKENLSRREPHYSQAKIIFEADELVNREDVDKYVLLIIDKINNTQIL
ncbi:shikimate kinase [Dysgonomonas alginatilytica]|uniref:Shikimate kinase n=1 Tax=Dysgonomonas alginatilytica TaxID=1605892 RepID=A0A2V3PQE6_9BACT|nr:shikimate kinase [Dysgonomonas alginatilytica]PXV64137.1 shikimate kinase [Dysgonomonas alginatilytica]